MFTPGTCPGCGLSLPALAFDYARAVMIAQAEAQTQAQLDRAPAALPELSLIDASQRHDCSRVYDALGVDGDCCRIHLATTVSWVNKYG
jgi:hypothetical protein